MITTKDIETEFESQLSKISDPELKKKVVGAWVAACREGGWESIEALKALPFTIATNANGIGLIRHIKAAAEGAVALARIQKEQIPEFPDVDMDVIVAGALVNDINKVMAFVLDGTGNYRNTPDQKKTAEFPGVAITREAGLPENIVKIVEYECSKGKTGPANIETIFIHHADFITFDSMHYLNNR